MKKLLLLVLLFISVVANAQKGISYQAIILDPSKIEIPGQDISGQPYVNGNVNVKFVILSGTTSQFEEVQQTKTDAYGLVNLTIGSVASTTFNALTWDANQKSMQVFVSFNNGASYTKVSDQKLTYSPYALFAETAGKLSTTLGITGGGTGATTAVVARANLGLGNVDNTADADKPISAATRTALNLKANATDMNAGLDLKAPLASPTFTGTVSGISNSMVGLGNVDNTADADKPISAATQAALDLKASAAMLASHMAITVDTSMLATKAALTDLNNYAPKASPTFTGTVSGIDKAMVGLGSVDNTSDAAKPISTAMQAALDLKANGSNVSASLASKASLFSPAFSGFPTAPTATAGTNSTQIATTAFTTAAIAAATAGVSSGVADNSVTSVKIADGSISTVDLANGSVSDAKIQTVSGSKITGVIPVLSGGTGLNSFGLIGQVLTSTGTGTMTWTTSASGGGSGVPYTGATGSVDLGGYNLTVNGITVGSNGNLDFMSPAYSSTILGKNATISNNRSYAIAIGYNANAAVQATAIGSGAMANVTQGMAIGFNTTSTGGYGMAVGPQARASSLYATAIGNLSNASANYALSIGTFSNASGVNSTAIGYQATNSIDNTIQLGNASITNVNTSGTITSGAVTYPNAHGINGQVLSTTGSGTLTWTSISAGVPYSGATGAVNLGAYNLTVNGIDVGKGNNSGITTNTVLGNGALANALTADYNTAIGHNALNVNAGNNSFGNTAVGANTLTRNTASRNTAVGESSLQFNELGESNTAVGEFALSAVVNGNNNTGVGNFSLSTNVGEQNTGLGAGADVSVANISNATAIGYNAKVGASNTIQLGNTSVTNVKTSGTITAGGVTYPNAHGSANQVLSTTGSGTLTWTTPSSGGSGGTHTIGEAYGGGIVFYVYDGGKHGLIAATADQSTGIRWYGGTSTNTRARAVGIGAGLKNTALIIANQAAVDGNDFAATVCNDYSVTETVGGISTTYGDWYLPSTYELDLLYLQKVVVGGFSGAPYWSSTEGDAGGARSLNFADRSGNNNYKSDLKSVRAIRSF